MSEFNNIQRFVLVLVILLFVIHFPISHCCHEHERNALLSFKSLLDDPSDRLSSWKVGRNCCNWHGIQCSHDSFHVVAVDLRNPKPDPDIISYSFQPYALNGTISPSLFNLTRLQYLDLSFNHFQLSKIPHQFANLKHLTYLNLSMGSNNFLHSSIPIQLANLTSLSILDLFGCQLEGSIPYLPHQLKELYIGFNRLTVNLTWVFDHQWPKLQVLSIGGTNVNGPIPSSISNASSLVSLSASDCSINGSIPISISNLSQLQYLDLSRNNLQGSIPETICEIRHLQLLDLSDNKLNGTIPSCIAKLENLQKFDVGNNSIGGNISLITMINKPNLTSLVLDSNELTVEIDQYYSLPSNKSQLQRLGLSSCNLKGHIPAFICNMTQLDTLDLSRNNLIGVIPSCIFKLPKMDQLDLSNNNLQGTLPQSLSIVTNLYYLLDLSNNKLSGKISTEIGKRLYSIQTVFLSGNKLPGSIPSTICSEEVWRSKDLQIQDKGFIVTLDLSNNSLSGTIPSTIEYCTSLQILNLKMNNLSGKIPNELERATDLEYLQLSYNSFTGPFPGSIQKLRNLAVLCLGNNNFGGNIPSLIGSLYNLRILSLRSNRFNGSIPKEITHLSMLQFLDFSNNNLSGLIPLRMGNLGMLTSRPKDSILDGIKPLFEDIAEMQMVTKGITQLLKGIHDYNSGIDLSCNILEGHIPEEICLLTGLAMLNLSHNHLSNKIPKNVGNMSSLESMDLSFNSLSGDIPQSLTLMDSLQVLDLSYNNLSGRIPTGPHFDTLSVDGSAYIQNPLLCGLPTKNCCKGDPGCSGGEQASREEEEDEEEVDGKEKWLFCGVVIFGIGVGFWGLFIVLLLKKEKWWFGYWRVIDAIAARILGCMSRKRK